MTWTIQVTWVTFLVSQVGLICKLNYLDVTKKFSCHVTLATFKMKTPACGLQVGHMWVTFGFFCGSVGQMGQQV